MHDGVSSLTALNYKQNKKAPYKYLSQKETGPELVTFALDSEWRNIPFPNPIKENLSIFPAQVHNVDVHMR